MYHIKITETRTVERKIGHVWKIGAKPTPEDKEGYGYTPRIDSEVDIDVEILSQSVENLDLNAVIKAVNNL